MVNQNNFDEVAQGRILSKLLPDYQISPKSTVQLKLFAPLGDVVVILKVQSLNMSQIKLTFWEIALR